MSSKQFSFVVEHLDQELGSWSKLEYRTIAEETRAAGAKFTLSSVPSELLVSGKLQGIVDSVCTEPIERHMADRLDQICLLDPAATQELSPEDGDCFDTFLFGGILGDDPPRDRTSELRKRGFVGRKLGPVQMTTDTAVRVTRMVVLGKTKLASIPYVDHPELRLNDHESTEMPFRYVCDKDGLPVMPEGMLALIAEDSDKAFDLLEVADMTDT